MKLFNFNIFWLLVASSAARDGIFTQLSHKDVSSGTWQEKPLGPFQLWKRALDDHSEKHISHTPDKIRYENEPPSASGTTNFDLGESSLLDFDSYLPDQEKAPSIETEARDSDSEDARLFIYSLNKFFAQLLSFISDDEVITQSFAGRNKALETEMERISSLFSELSFSGNLYRSTVSRPFQITRSLHQLLVYRSALEAKYVKKIVSNNGDRTGAKTGVFVLNLVELEIFLFTFFRSDASLDLHAGDCASRLDSADSILEILHKDFERAVTPGTHLASVLEKETDRLKGILQGLKQIHEAQKAEATTSPSSAPLEKKRNLRSVSQYSMATPTAESASQNVMDQLERDIFSVKRALVSCSNDGEIDVEKYNSVKEAIKIIAMKSDEQDYPEAAKVKLEQFITEIEHETALMDGIVDANMASGQSIPDHNRLVSARSALVEIKEIEGHVERQFQNLLRIKDYTSGFQVVVFKSTIDYQKSRVNAIASSIDSGVWDGDDVALLDTLRMKTERLSKNIKIMLTFLSGIETEDINSDEFISHEPVFPAPSAPELTEYDMRVFEPIDQKLQDIEEGLLEFFKPTNWSLSALRVHVEAYKRHFRSMLRDANREGLVLTPLRRFKRDKIKAMIVRLEEALKEVPADVRGDTKQ